MKRLLLALIMAAISLLVVSCETDDNRGPDDGSSSIPWNRPQPGERTSPLAPFQSH